MVQNNVAGHLGKKCSQDIFNTDETGLYQRPIPDHCLLFKKSLAAASKKLKDRLVEKLRLLVLEKSKKPRCFKGAEELLVEYGSNLDAWMTDQIFENFLQEPNLVITPRDMTETEFNEMHGYLSIMV